MKTISTNVQARSVCNALKIAFTVLMITTFGSRTFAQGVDSVSIALFPHFIDYPAVSLNIGYTVTLKIHVGEVDDPAYDIAGFALELELSGSAEVPETVTSDLDASWLMENDNLVNTSWVNATTGVLHLNVVRDDTSGLTGYGEVIRVTLTSAANGVGPEELFSSIGGSMTVVDNLEMKTHYPTPSLKVWPNPAVDQLNVQGLQEGTDLRIFDQKGKVWALTPIQEV